MATTTCGLIAHRGGVISAAVKQQHKNNRAAVSNAITIEQHGKGSSFPRAAGIACFATNISGVDRIDKYIAVTHDGNAGAAENRNINAARHRIKQRRDEHGLLLSSSSHPLSFPIYIYYVRRFTISACCVCTWPTISCLQYIFPITIATITCSASCILRFTTLFLLHFTSDRTPHFHSLPADPPAFHLFTPF